MKDVLDKLGEAHEEIQKIDEKAREVLADVLLRESNVIKRENSVEEKEKELSDREEKVADIENVVAMKKEATELMAQAHELLSKQKDAEIEFNQTMKIENDKINDARALSSKEQDNVDRQKKDIEIEIGKRVEQCLINMGIKKG